MKKIVLVGGGSGSFEVLRGLKNYPYEIVSIPTTFDSGTHTGEIRDKFGTLPAGDVRRHILALAPEDSASILRQIFMFRFKERGYSHSKSLGNLIIMAAEKITEHPVSGIDAISRLFNIRGRVLPVSIDDAHVCVKLKDGRVIRGEANIDKPKHDGNIPIVSVYLEPKAVIYSETHDAIVSADLIVFSPGDLYTSNLPNIVVQGFKEAVHKCRGQKICVGNLMTKWGETNGYAVADCVRVILRYLGLKKFDAVITHSLPLNPALLKKYAKEKAYPMAVNEAKLSRYARRIIKGNVVDESGGIIRHSARKLALLINECLS